MILIPERLKEEKPGRLSYFKLINVSLEFIKA
jgi:hypothetical protein